MQVCDLILDSQGHLWLAPFRELGEALRSRQPSAKLADFVVKNLGYVRFRLHRQGLVVAFRPKLLSAPTLVQAMHLIADLPCRRVALSELHQAWRYRLCKDRLEAIENLNQLLLDRNAENVALNYMRKRIERAELARHSPFHEVLALAAGRPANLDPAEIDRKLPAPLQGRFVIVTPQEGQQTLLIEHWGERLGSYHPRWATLAPGMRFQDQPDYRYGCAATPAYTTVLRRGVSVLEQIDAIMSQRGGEEQRIRYCRLITLLRARGGRLRLLSTSLMDPGIDLRGGIQAG